MYQQRMQSIQRTAPTAGIVRIRTMKLNPQRRNMCVSLVAAVPTLVALLCATTLHRRNAMSGAGHRCVPHAAHETKEGSP